MSLRSMPSDSSNLTVALEGRSAGSEAGTCHGRTLTSGDRHGKVTGLVFVEPDQEVARGAAQTDDDPAVLNAMVGIQESSTDRTHLRPFRLSAERVQPTRGQSLDIVVQEDEDLTGRHRGRRIVQRRPVEGAVITQDADIRPVAKPFEKRHRLGLDRPVVDQKVLGADRTPRPVDGVDARPQEARFVSKRDDDARRCVGGAGRGGCEPCLRHAPAGPTQARRVGSAPWRRDPCPPAPRWVPGQRRSGDGTGLRGCAGPSPPLHRRATRGRVREPLVFRPSPAATV